MQEKVCSEGSGSFHDGGLYLRSPDALHAHPEYPHEYGGFSITGELPADRGGRRPTAAGRGPHVRSLSDGREAAHFLMSRRRTQSVGVGTEDGRNAGGAPQDATPDEVRRRRPVFPLDPDLHADPDLNAEPPGGGCLSGTDAAPSSSAAVCPRGPGDVLRRRLARVRTELARADSQLLCERARSQRLTRQRQEVAEKERSLSRQVDVAVAVIAALKQQINASENELEQRERQVLTIQNFLEAAARQETSGKVRIQFFIENLLRRIAQAETLLENYQPQQTPTGRSKPLRMAKSRSAGCQLSSGLHGNTTPSSGEQRDREQRERLARASRLFCRPERRDDIWNQRQRSAGYEA
ncbi:protein ZNF365 [Syngnathoides biaculeatus]|uniref:protein ZNF365 n=1 Tax=Syngnathoides biaculeatus TaxID=300417 RepID=UPI002ADE6846|nr:protein ZNF365 [Syngnathoides biaculeatus]XP_061692485.1 protein ZNF365 [Syngnathoides biaculeatus]